MYICTVTWVLTCLVLGHVCHPLSFLLFKGRMRYDKHCLKCNCFSCSVSLLSYSGADYYDYGHGLSEETYESYGEQLCKLNDYSSTLLERYNQRRTSIRQASALHWITDVQGSLHCHIDLCVVVEKNTEGDVCGVSVNTVV